MNQSEQAQAIAEIKAIRNGGEYPRTYYREAIDKALEIVDSQAQKIAKMYLAAYLKEKKALFRPDNEHKKAEANLRAIRKKLAEWEKIK